MGAILERALSRRLNQQLDGQIREDWLTIIGELFDEALALSTSMSTETWKDTAQGWWLDRVGEIVGVGRPQEEEVTRIFRCRSDSDPDYDPNHGFGDEPPSAIGGFIWDDQTGVPTSPPAEASDATYLDFINAKIAATNADASIPGLARYASNAFDVSVTVTVPSKRNVEMALNDVVDLRKRRFLELFAPVVAGVDFRVTGWTDW